jgi:hypothetical protein
MEENYEVINITEYLSYDHFKNICFISEGLEIQHNKNGIDYFSQNLRYDTYPIVYKNNSDKNKLKEDLISKFKNVERICFAFHKPKSLSDEVLFINNLPFFSKNGNNDSVQFLHELYDSLKIKHVDFLACELLLSNEWNTFFAKFKDVTIGASIDNTGNIKFGGDWIMESTMTNIKNIYFNENIDNFASLLNTYTDNEGFSYTNYNTTDLRITAFPESNPDLELSIPSTLTIGENETFPSGTYTVKSIQSTALNHNKTFKKLFIPSTIEYFEFSHSLPAIEYISVDTNNLYYYSINDKIAIRKSDETLIICCNINSTSRIILDTVKIIGFQSFRGCSNLKYIECPNVTYIHDKAFVLCSSLTTAIFRKVEHIRNSAFTGLSKLTKLIIPEVHTLRNDSISGISITSLYVPKLVTNIGASFPSDLTDLTVNSNTQIYGVMPPNLKKITILQSTTNNLKTIKSGTVVVYNNNVVHIMKDIFNTLKTHIITINGPTGITNHAGSNLTRSFEINSDTVTTVDMEGATNLVKLNTPNLLHILKRGLDSTSITNAHFPNLESVGQYGFARNSNLKSFYISPNLSLNEQAFRDGLNNLNEIIFDKNLTEINDSVINAFNSSTYNISNPITSVKVSDAKTNMTDSFMLPNYIEEFPTSIVNVKGIKNKCKNIINIGGLTNIDSTNFHDDGELIETINIKSNLLSINGNFVNATAYFENNNMLEQFSEKFSEKYVGILNNSDIDLNVNRYHNEVYINKLSSAFDNNVYNTINKKKEYTKGMIKSILKMYKNNNIVMKDITYDSLPGFTPNVNKQLYIYDGKTKQKYLRDEMISKSFYIYTEPGTSVEIETVDFYLINVTQNTETEFLINVTDSQGDIIQESTNYYKGDAYYFNGTSFTLGSIQGESEIVVCFAEDTDILCLDNDTGNEIYVNVKDLKEGTYVKTLNSGYIPVYKTKSRDINYKNNINKTEIERTSDRIFKYEKDENMTKDLFLTGSHAILKDELTDDETIKVKQFMKNLLKQDTDMMPVTEGKFRLMCMYDKNAELINEQDTTVYHVALEHSDNNMNYGIYANGKLVESCSKYSIDEMFN